MPFEPSEVYEADEPRKQLATKSDVATVIATARKLQEEARALRHASRALVEESKAARRRDQQRSWRESPQRRTTKPL